MGNDTPKPVDRRAESHRSRWIAPLALLVFLAALTDCVLFFDTSVPVPPEVEVDDTTDVADDLDMAADDVGAEVDVILDVPPLDVPRDTPTDPPSDLLSDQREDTIGESNTDPDSPTDGPTDVLDIIDNR